MKICALIWLFAALASAAISNVRTPETTATQALIAYDAPDGSACTIQLSQNASLSPLALDVDPNTFANADSDLSRPSTVVVATTRFVVLGKRASEYATAGAYSLVRHYSRALQTNTQYFGLITCPSTGDTYAFNFTTANIPLGNTYGDPWLSDPTHPGDQPWPESLGGSTPESFIDPLTGVLLERLSLRGNDYRMWGPSNAPLPIFGDAYNQGYTSCDSGHAWTNPCGLIVKGGSGNTTAGNTQVPLILRPPLTPIGSGPWNSGYGSNSYNQFFSLDQLAVNITGYVNSSSAGNRVMDVCLSLNGGASCASTIQQMTLPQSCCSTQSVGQADPTKYGVIPWLLDTNPRLNVQETSPNSGTDTVSGNTVTWQGGASTNYWSLYWVTGGSGRIRLSTTSTADACTIPGTSSAEYTITGFVDGTHITVNPTPPAGANYWCENNFAVMVWRHAAPDSSIVTLTGANMSVVESYAPLYPDNGASAACLNKMVSGGFFCLYGGLYWINPTTGATAYYGYSYFTNPGIANTWNGFGGYPFGETPSIDQTQTVLTSYTVSSDPAGGGPLVLRVSFNPTSIAQPPAPYTTGSPFNGGTISSTTAYSATYSTGLSVTNLTPQNPGGKSQTIVSQMATFDPTFSPAMFSSGPNGWNCLPYGESQGVFFVACYSLGGDSPAWVIAFSPGDGNPANAGTAAGPRIIGAVNTFNTPNGPVASGQTAYTGRALHAVSETGETGWVGMSSHVYPPVSTTSTAIPASSPTTCASFGLAGNTNQCIQLTINSNAGSYEPYFISPYAQYQLKATPGLLRTTQLGDTVCVTTSSTSCNWEYPPYGQELMTLVVKPAGSNVWTFQRGIFSREYATSGTAYLWWQSPETAIAQSVLSDQGFMTVYWSPLYGCPGNTPDPHGNCLIQDANEVYSHGEWRDGGEAVVMNVPAWQQPEWGWPGDYQTIVGSVPNILKMPQSSETPNQVPGVNYVSATPPFAGAYGHPWGFDGGNHPNAAGSAAPPSEAIRAFDNIPFQGGGQNANPAFTAVAGQSQLFVTTPTSIVDPDDPFGYGGTPGLPAINRKLMAQGNSCGSHPLIDVSGPVASINAGTAGSYTVCYARNSNECLTGSTVGQVYVNCPGVVWPNCSGSGIHGGMPLGVGNDICVGNISTVANAVRQFTLDSTDLAGAFTRTLVSATARIRMVYGFENNRLLPDNSWLLFRGEWLNYQRPEMWAAKMPPWPAADAVNRGTFVPVSVGIDPPTNPAVANAIVQFGYQEFGAPQLLNCTSRNDACVAVTAAIPTGNQPYTFASENSTGMPCSQGCTVAVPAISQRVLYYRIQYRDANNAVLFTGPILARVVR